MPPLIISLSGGIVLVVSLSRGKGSFGPGHLPHDWIGVQFASHTPGTSTLSVPSAFLKDLLAIATKFTKTSPKTATLKDAHALCGKAGRLAQVIPAVTPWVQQLFAALAGSLWSHYVGMREAPTRRVAKRRYLSAATLLVQLLKEQQFPFRHAIHLQPHSSRDNAPNRFLHKSHLHIPSWLQSDLPSSNASAIVYARPPQTRLCTHVHHTC